MSRRRIFVFGTRFDHREKVIHRRGALGVKKLRGRCWSAIFIDSSISICYSTMTIKLMKFTCNLWFVFVPPPTLCFSAARQGLSNWQCFSPFSLFFSSNAMNEKKFVEISSDIKALSFFSFALICHKNDFSFFLPIYTNDTPNKFNSIYTQFFIAPTPILQTKEEKKRKFVCRGSSSLVWDVKRVDSDCAGRDREKRKIGK